MMKQIWNWLFGPRCRGCNCRGAQRRRMMTSYCNEELNWTVECDRCFDETQAYWADMWSDYYQGCM